MQDNNKKRVGFFTTFYKVDEAYSLTSVVFDQLIAHVKNGYTPVLFVLESFDQKDMDKIPAGVEVRGVVPQIILEPYSGLSYPTNYQEDVDRVVKALKEHAMDIEVMIAHDIIFIDSYLPYNLALREANLSCRYLHWVHSAPSPRPVLEGNPHASRYILPPNSKLVYLNNDKALDLAEMYGTWLSNVRVIPNSRDPRSFWNLDSFVSELIDRYDLLNADIITVYPLSATRMIGGKQIDVVIGIHEQLRKLGYKTKLVVCDAHANGDGERKAAMSRHSNDVVFTSLENGFEYENGVPSRIVSDLFRLSNVFIFPTVSENSSLCLAEAMMSGNLLILNKDVPTLAEHAGAAGAVYLRFGNFDNGIRKTEHAVEQDSYMRDIALIIKNEFENNRVLQAKRRVFQNQNYDVTFARTEALYYEV